MLSTHPRRPRRIVARTLGFGISALFAAGFLAWSPASTSGWNQGTAEATLWQLLNGARANNGMGVLQQHGTLVGLARWRSSDMLAKDYFSHTIAGCGCLVYTYYDRNGLAYDWAGENIGWNSGRTDAESPVRVHEQFMGSPGHRANVLDRRFTHGGVGAAQANGRMFQGHVQDTRMYTELFMQARASAPPPAPAPQPPGQPAPAPRPPSAGSGGSAAPAVPAAAAADAKPKPKRVRVDAPARPVSSAGIDGVAAVVSSPTYDELAKRLRVDEIAAARAAALTVTGGSTAAAPDVDLTASTMEVEPAPSADPGLLDGLVGAVLGFLFG